MLKQIYKLLTILILLTYSCKKEKITIKDKNTITINRFIKKEKFLKIEGSNIWVRSVPKKGKVIMKLNERDKCIIIDTSSIDTIKGCIDYWYKIKRKETIGWVFGSQTNIKSTQSKETLLFIKDNNDRLKCDNIDYKLISYKNKSYSYLSSIILFTREKTLDTLDLKNEKVHSNGYLEKVDYNFDGFCDLIYNDTETVSHRRINCYFFKYNIITRNFVKDKTFPFPVENAGIIINTKKRQVEIKNDSLCCDSGGDCDYDDCGKTFIYKF